MCDLQTFSQDLHNYQKALWAWLVTTDFSKPLSILANTCYLTTPTRIATGTTGFPLDTDSWGLDFGFLIIHFSPSAALQLLTFSLANNGRGWACLRSWREAALPRSHLLRYTWCGETSESGGPAAEQVWWKNPACPLVPVAHSHKLRCYQLCELRQVWLGKALG